MMYDCPQELIHRKDLLCQNPEGGSITEGIKVPGKNKNTTGRNLSISPISGLAGMRTYGRENVSPHRGSRKNGRFINGRRDSG